MVPGSLWRLQSSTMRRKAALACRSPPRQRRKRCHVPEDAGIGAPPQRAANLALVVMRFGLSPAVASRCAATNGPTPLAARRWVLTLGKQAELVIDRSNVFRQRLVALREPLRGYSSYQPRSGPRRRTCARESDRQFVTVKATKILSDCLGRTDQQSVDLIDARVACRGGRKSVCRPRMIIRITSCATERFK